MILNQSFPFKSSPRWKTDSGSIRDSKGLTTKSRRGLQQASALASHGNCQVLVPVPCLSPHQRLPLLSHFNVLYVPSFLPEGSFSNLCTFHIFVHIYFTINSRYPTLCCLEQASDRDGTSNCSNVLFPMTSHFVQQGWRQITTSHILLLRALWFNLSRGLSA